MPAMKRRNRSAVTWSARNLLQDNQHQREQIEATAPHEQQEDTSSISGNSLFEFDVRDLAWLQIISLLLTEQAAPSVVESIPFSEDAEAPAVLEEITQDDEPSVSSIPTSKAGVRSPWPARTSAWLLISAGLMSAGLLLLLGLLLAVPLLTPTATVTIIPQATMLSAATTVTIVTAGTPDPAQAEISGRRLTTLILAQAQTIPTTDMGHQDAQAAHGLVTFYNALPEVQTIPAGTLLVGDDGVKVLTDQQAVLPAAIPPTDGQVSVVAHAIVPGPGGNIAAGDIHGPCCRAYVLALNQAAYSGGRDARLFPVLSQHDLDRAVGSLTASLTRSVQAALSAQLHAGEALLTPLSCKQRVMSDHQAGEEASHVTVTLSETCTGIAYQQTALQVQLTRRLSQEAAARLGSHYVRVGNVQRASVATRWTTTLPQLMVHFTGVWVYQFTQHEFDALAQQIAGKSQTEATALLLRQRGVSGVVLHLTGTQILPADPAHIHFLVLLRWG